VPPRRDYDALPRCTTDEMDESDELDGISFPIEAAVCSLDRERRFTMLDSQAIAIFELLIDLYVFGDPEEAVAGRVRELGCQSVLDIVRRELAGCDPEKVAKVLGVVRLVACRRNRGGRSHMNVLQEYNGAFLWSGIGLRRYPDGREVASGRMPPDPDDPEFQKLLDDLRARDIEFVLRTSTEVRGFDPE